MNVASIEQIQTPEGQTATGSDADATWGRYIQSAGSSEFPRLWLALLCARIPAARSALVLLGTTDRGPFTPAAVWPEPGRDLTHLTPVAERTLRERRGMALQRGDDAARVGEAGYDLSYPLLIGDALHGAIVVEVSELPAEALQQALQQIHWGAASLELELLQRQQDADAKARQRVFALLDLISVAVEESRLQSAAVTLVSELATHLDCDRVSIGLRKGRQMRVQAISHSATFARQMNLTRLTEAAMDEATDQETRVWYPLDDDNTIAVAHQALAQQQGAAELCTIPIAVQGSYEAALTIERPAGRRLQPIEADFCESLGEIATPLLLCKREQERWLVVKAARSLRAQFVRLFGPAYLGRKLVGLALLAVTAFFVLATGDYRITAQATLEGGQLRSLVTPFNGYIESAEARAGEQVTEGSLLATLDDRDLKLEQVRLATERAEYRRKRRQAGADHDRALVRILTAQIEQANAQLALVEEQLARTRVRAPFDGILVSGDLSQSLGAPVQQGDSLFEIAPLGSYRVRLAVNERDIDDVSAGQAGTLVLSALPEQGLPIKITLVTPVATVVDGQNTFSVEASLAQVPDALRPGMEGIGKIYVGERRLAWIWTRGFVQWFQLKLWAWSP